MNKFIFFTNEVNSFTLPNNFDYPYNYTPNSIAKIAASELQEYLKKQTDFSHDFGLDDTDNKNASGKMFGVLVVKNSKGILGYLAAFSGQISESTTHNHFVPTVYDVLSKQRILLQVNEKYKQINQILHNLKNSLPYLNTKKKYLKNKLQHESLIVEEQTKIKERRKDRKKQGKQHNQLNINEEFYIHEYEVYLNNKIDSLKKEYIKYSQQIIQLEEELIAASVSGKQQILKQYLFLNTKNEAKNLLDIFNDSPQNIPNNSGDCCIPKLLQYAFSHNFTPICMGQFWWGKPLTTAVRKHKYYYTACTTKCKPILNHMLKGLNVNENPLLVQHQEKKELKIIFEDDSLMVINKPCGLLSVPGKEIQDSVYVRIKKMFPNATGPLVVHRLDMATSGILLIAKSIEVYKALQVQFANRIIKKRYVALLDGTLANKKGEINLPLRVDLNDRPKQLVCNDHGKSARTKWEVIEIKKNKTKVYFYPITGRTHQLRVHAAHNLGLNTAIIGDDLYGASSNRLHLHAEKIGFNHPITKKWVEFTEPTSF